MDEIVVKPGREKSILRRHPWIFSGAVDEVTGSPTPGETVIIRDARGAFLARGAYSPRSQIRVRIWSWDEKEEISAGFIRGRLIRALALRDRLPDLKQTNARRLVHGESDGLPGLVLDQYGDTLVVQFLSYGAEYWRETIADDLLELTRCRSIYERSDVDVRNLEGLPSRTGLLRGDDPPEKVLIEEYGLKFWVDIRQGHKTGFYIDQRLNRQRVRSLAAGREVLDCFCYTGGFSLTALAGGAASVLAVDASPLAVHLGQENLRLNDLSSEMVEWMEGDVFQVLRNFRDRGRSFDMVVLDPPKFAATTKQVDRASRGYKDINLLALKLLRPGGVLATFSCSGGVSLDLFQKIVAGAALDAQVDARIIETFFQASDHPTAVNFPEGQYLKGLLVYVA